MTSRLRFSFSFLCLIVFLAIVGELLVGLEEIYPMQIVPSYELRLVRYPPWAFFSKEILYCEFRILLSLVC